MPLGLYQALWIYTAWRYVRDQRNGRDQPLLRAIFAPIFLYSPFRHLFEMAQERGYPERPPAFPLAPIYFVFEVMGHLLPFPFGLVRLLKIVPMLPAVETQQYTVRAEIPGVPDRHGFSGVELLLVALGVVTWSVAVAGTVNPALLPAA